MRYRALPVVREDRDDVEEIEARISRLLRDSLYRPLVKLLGRKPASVLKNAREDLLAAIRSDRIRYIDGRFEGSFSAEISRELQKLGAVWDKKRSAWRLVESKLSNDIVDAISASYARFKEMAAQVDAQLGRIVPAEIAQKLRLENLFDSTLYRVNRNLEKSITIEVKFSPKARARISKEYTRNMQLYVKDFAEKEIVKLRKAVEKSTLSGLRFEGFEKTIQDSWDVTRSKAKFLARQETNLLVTKFKQTRYQEAGIDNYRWACVAGSAAHPVRPMHKKLDGKVFSWNNPPIVNEKGDRKNPGQDYGCRCVAVPQVKF